MLLGQRRVAGQGRLCPEVGQARATAQEQCHGDQNQLPKVTPVALITGKNEPRSSRQSAGHPQWLA